MYIRHGNDEDKVRITFETGVEHIAFIGLFPVWTPTGMRLAWNYAEYYIHGYPQTLELRSRGIGQAALRLAPKIDAPNHPPVWDWIGTVINDYMEQRFLEVMAAGNE